MLRPSAPTRPVSCTTGRYRNSEYGPVFSSSAGLHSGVLPARRQAEDLGKELVGAPARLVVMDHGHHHEFLNPKRGRHANELGVHLLGRADDVTGPLPFVRRHLVGAGTQPGEGLLGRGYLAGISTQL